MQRDRERLNDILEAAEDAIALCSEIDAAGFAENKPMRYAILYCLTIIGEAANQISEQLRNEHPVVPWRKIIAFRHRVVHGYGELDLALAWEVARSLVPDLRQQIADIAASFPDPSQGAQKLV